MANKFRGEKELELGGINYKMIIDMDVVSEFEAETGNCFMNKTVTSIHAMIKTRSIKNAFERGEIMTNAVSRKDAAWLFYLAAKKANSQVEFGEIQEAVMREGPLDGENVSYPILFAVLLDFAVTGGIKKEFAKQQLKQFNTFIECNKPVDELDIYKWLGLCVSRLGISPSEFWTMPFFMVIELLKQIAPTSDKPTRKQVINNMKVHNKLYGWV